VSESAEILADWDRRVVLARSVARYALEEAERLGSV